MTTTHPNSAATESKMAADAAALIAKLDPVGEIQELLESGSDGGSLLGFFCRGHVARYEFAQACNAKSGAITSYDVRHVRPDECHHVWWRTVPMSGEPGCTQYVPAEPGARGAWKATAWEGVARSRIYGMRDYIATDRAGHRRGFAEGVNWAIRKLTNHNPAAGDQLLAVWRAHGTAAQEQHHDTGTGR